MRRFGWWPFAALAIVVAGCGSNPPAIVSGHGDASVSDGGLPQDGSSGDDGAVGSDDSSAVDATTAEDGSSSTNPDSAMADDGPASGNVDGSVFGPDGSVSVSCTAFGGACSYGASCCSGICDTKTNTCASSISKCAPASAACAGNTDCCSGSCVNGQCGGVQCLTIGAACPVAGNTCCTANCSGGKCQAISPTPTCVTANNTCTTSAECCSGLCDQGRCALGSSYCIQNNDICYHADDCCGGICTAPDGNPVSATNPGLCSQPTSGGVNCTGLDGELCPHAGDAGSCGNCCSRLCAPYGPTGTFICQPAQGCRVEGDICRKDSDCCGSSDSSVQCSNHGTTAAVGVCMTPTASAGGMACDPNGDVCHYQNYTCSISTSQADCCGTVNPKFIICQLDTLGVPRCLGTDVTKDGGVICVPSGGSCAEATECCGKPCVPDSSGELVCSANVCQMSGQSCTTNADCCTGLPCVAPPGSIQGVCTPVTPPPPPPSDAGTSSDGGSGDGGSGTGGGSDGGGSTTCGLFGQLCGAGLPTCCTGTTCIGGKCSVN